MRPPPTLGLSGELFSLEASVQVWLPLEAFSLWKNEMLLSLYPHHLDSCTNTAPRDSLFSNHATSPGPSGLSTVPGRWSVSVPLLNELLAMLHSAAHGDVFLKCCIEVAAQAVCCREHCEQIKIGMEAPVVQSTAGGSVRSPPWQTNRKSRVSPPSSIRMDSVLFTTYVTLDKLPKLSVPQYHHPYGGTESLLARW